MSGEERLGTRIHDPVTDHRVECVVTPVTSIAKFSTQTRRRLHGRRAAVIARAHLELASGPGRFLGEEKRPGAICSRMREKLRKITVKSLVYVEMKYTAEWYSVQDYYYTYTLAYTDRIREYATV